MNQSRYHRQTLLPQIGPAGQARLGASHALLVGCGALGCAAADLLVRAGVGTLTIVDRDVVEITNLQRQTLFDERDARAAAPKAEAAAARLARVNSAVRIRPVVADFSSRTAAAIFDGSFVSGFNAEGAARGAGGAGGEGRGGEPLSAAASSSTPDVIIDGVDNFLTRYLLNDLATARNVPLVYAGAVATHAMSMTIRPGATACLRCVFPDVPPPGAAATCDTAGILGPVAAMIAAFQAVEAIKILSGSPDACSRELIELDPWSLSLRRVSLALARDPECPCCGLRRFDFLDGGYDDSTQIICTRHGGGAVQILPHRHEASAPAAGAGKAAGELFLPALLRRLHPHGDFAHSPGVLRGVLERESIDGANPVELTVFADGRAVIRGTTDPVAARAVYARYVGQ